MAENVFLSIVQAVTEVLNKSHFSFQMGKSPLQIVKHYDLKQIDSLSVKRGRFARLKIYIALSIAFLWIINSSIHAIDLLSFFPCNTTLLVAH